MLDGHQTREEILRLLDANRAALLATLQRHGWDVPDANGWSGKDHLAHTATWSRRLAEEFRMGLAGQVVHWPEEGYQLDQIDALNERDWRLWRDRPLDEVQSAFEDAHADVVRVVEGLSDADLNGSDRFDWLPIPARVAFEANAFGHYLQHARMVMGNAEP